MKDREAGSRVETRRGHVEVVANADDIRIRVVGVENRILVSPVTVIGDPNFRDRRRRCGSLRNYARGGERKKQKRDRL